MTEALTTTVTITPQQQRNLYRKTKSRLFGTGQQQPDKRVKLKPTMQPSNRTAAP